MKNGEVASPGEGENDAMEELLLWEFPPKVREWATLLFFWSGVAIWVGLAARCLIPARVVRGPWLTLCLGFVGSCLGPFALCSFFRLADYDPIGPSGLFASVFAATATLCLFYVVAFFFPSRSDDDRRDLDVEEDERDDFDEEEERDERLRPKARKPRRRQSVERERGDNVYREPKRERNRRQGDAEYENEYRREYDDEYNGANNFVEREAERGRRTRAR